MGVSIHAPARMRHDFQYILSNEFMFQSTHPRGCDAVHWMSYYAINCFNPRTREDATCERLAISDGQRVSIHAPARMRRGINFEAEEAIKFQSTHPRGCDAWSRACFCGMVQSSFNPRTREDATGLKKPQHYYFWRFNPRTREDATGETVIYPNINTVSIHAPARMRPQLLLLLLLPLLVSIHAPARMRRRTPRSAHS